MARGQATQVMTYPRPKTKSVLVRAAKDAGRKLSNFILVAALEKVAETRGCSVQDLIPSIEYESLMKNGSEKPVAPAPSL